MVAASLVVGFAVAQATGVRPLGAIPLVAGCGWAALRWLEAAGPARAVVLVGVYLAVFVVSHPLADVIGAWPAVLLGAAAAATAAWALADAPAGRRPLARG